MVVGLTGVIGSGKSTVASIFKEIGAGIISADEIAHRLLLKNNKGYNAVVKEWGPKILNEKGGISREILAKIVFDNKKELEKLNKIMHPLIYEEYKKELEILKEKGYSIIIYDAPLLIELSLHKEMDKVIVVIAEQEIIFDRLKRKGLSIDEIKLRMRYQLPQQEKIKYADFIINNNNGIDELKKQIEQIWNILLSLK